MTCIESISVGKRNLLELIRYLGFRIRLISASISESFGQTEDILASEETLLRSRSPYALVKGVLEVVIRKLAGDLDALLGSLGDVEKRLHQ